MWGVEQANKANTFLLQKAEDMQEEIAKEYKQTNNADCLEDIKTLKQVEKHLFNVVIYGSSFMEKQ